jgi:hypothetical protein
MQSSSKSFSISLMSFLAIPLMYLSNYYNDVLFIYLFLISLIAFVVGAVGKVKKFRGLKRSRASYHHGSTSHSQAKRVRDKNWAQFSNKSLPR